ncbi:MAG: SPOR domain-containing protein [Gammaproteobacteria bacterium]
MQVGLKERLIGAVVLVVLAVIIIPWVLKGGSAPSSTVTKPLALPPATTAAQAATAAAPQAYRMDLANSAATGTGSMPATAATQPAVVAAPGANPAANPASIQPASRTAAQPTPASGMTATTGKWAVQAGSYGNETHARSVERKLTQHGYHAYISRYHKGGRTYYRVRVGSYEDKAAAERIVTEVSRAYGGRAQVVPNY